MKINNKIMEELLSDDGHMGTILYSSEYQKLPRREGTIEALKNLNVKNVMHIGCCGHLLNIKKQLESKTSLHIMLIENFNKVIGFDINQEAVQYFSKYADNVYAKDVLHDNYDVSQIIQKVFGKEPYAILIPEVLEHIPDPAAFLEYIGKVYGGQQNPIIITVPNAYGFGRICDALLHNKEYINMDHKYMFTPTTLLKVMCAAGITPKEIQFMELYKYSKIFKKPICANTLLAIGNRN